MSRIERICLKSVVRSGREADTRCMLAIVLLLIWVGSEITMGDTWVIVPFLFLADLIACLIAYRDRVLLRLLPVEEGIADAANGPGSTPVNPPSVRDLR